MKKIWKPPFQLNEKAKKLILTMKLTVFILFLTLMQVSATVYSQATKFSFRAENKQVVEVLRQIEENSDFRFFFLREQVDVERKVSVTAREATVEQILEELFRGEPVSYEFANEALIVLTRSDNPLGSVNSYLQENMQQPAVSGTVTDESGQPLPGVTVLIKGTTRGTVTNGDGNYSLSNIQEDATLQFSFVGMLTQEIEVGNQSTIDVTMVIDAIGIEEVVAVGYGTMKKSDLTGSVASVAAEDINLKPVSNLASALQGQVAGVNITQRQGIPGAPAQIRIRGSNSLSAGVNDPLYVVDGMILSDLGAGFDFSDAASIQILKDASASAIYGSRGANGVVIITTKRGESGNPEVGFSSYVGTQSLIKELDFLEADQFKELYRTAKQNASQDVAVEENVINSNSNTDWIDEVYRTAMIQNYSAYIRGGNEASKYYASLGYFDQEGIIKNTDFSRLSLRVNGDWKISDAFQVSNNANMFYTLRNGTTGYESVSNGVAWARPTQPVKDEDGNYTRIVLPFERSNPRALVDLLTNENTGLGLVNNLVLDFKLAKGLTGKVNFGAEININSRGSYTPTSLSESSYLGDAQKSMNKNISWINENTINYETTFSEIHQINVMGGITFQKSVGDGVTGSSQGYTVDGFEYHNLGAGEEQFASSNYWDNSLMSYLGRLNYAYKDKYLITVTGRYDGSSRLSEGNNWAFFPSGAVGWRITEEDFLKDNSTLSNLKVRASWGITGSQAVAPYSTLSRFGTVNVYLDGETPSVGYIPQSVANKNLGWENTTQFDIGVDIGFLDGRIQLIADYYKKLTSDLLFNRLVPPSSGYTSSVQNIGKVENNGYEFSMITQNVKGLFNWSSNFNISVNRAEVVDLGKNPAGEDVEMIQVSGSWFYIIKGEVPYSPYGYVVDHLDLEANEYVYKDLNEDGAIDVNDQQVIGNPEPKFIFGFTNKMDFKNFDLLFLFQGSIGNDLFVDAMNHMTTLNGDNNTLQSVYNNAGIKYRAPDADNDYVRLDDNTVFDGTYIRLKEISLGYTLPKLTVSRVGLSNVRIYATGTNLLTFDNDYPWFDPETSSGNDVIVGWDRGGYPNNKSVVAGIQIKF